MHTPKALYEDENDTNSNYLTASNYSKPMCIHFAKKMSKLLPIYYLLISFAFFACLLQQTFLLLSKDIQLSLFFHIMVYFALAYHSLIFIASIWIYCINVQENQDIISTCLIFLMLHRLVIIPASTYMAVSSYMSYKQAQNSESTAIQDVSDETKTIFMDSLVMSIIGLVELISTSIVFTIHQIYLRISDQPVYELSPEDLAHSSFGKNQPIKRGYSIRYDNAELEGFHFDQEELGGPLTRHRTQFIHNPMENMGATRLSEYQRASDIDSYEVHDSFLGPLLGNRSKTFRS